ncbi:MAG TPA: rhodanese-like domain-containing protein [Candidatus Binatia bacterium]|nr:rhodanese-like domain-containing protein [Candidatus Binatia bacterium]
MPSEISPAELRDRLTTATPPLVLDVREPKEIALARFDGALAIPMGDVPARVEDLPRDREIVVLCHHGVRSAQVASFLVHHGLDRVVNLRGGIDAWSLQVDPGVPRY